MGTHHRFIVSTLRTGKLLIFLIDRRFRYFSRYILVVIFSDPDFYYGFHSRFADYSRLAASTAFIACTRASFAASFEGYVDITNTPGVNPTPKNSRRTEAASTSANLPHCTTG